MRGVSSRAGVSLLAVLASCAGANLEAPVSERAAPADAGPGEDVTVSAPREAGASTADVTTAPGCGELASARTAFVCAPDGMSRGKCPDGVTPLREACARGCLRAETGKDAVCMGTTNTWSCSGAYGTTKVEDGDYYLTAFGCWVDAVGGKHGDPGDNCIPACLATLKARGLCVAADTGKACEERITWFVADSARFGCGARVRVSNPANGRSVVAAVIDAGPACFVERSVSHAILDASGRVNRELFGSDRGAVDRSLVHVVEVDPRTPLGP